MLLLPDGVGRIVDYLDEPLCHLAVRVLLSAISDARRGNRSARRFLQTTGADWAGALGIDREAWLGAVARIEKSKAERVGRQPRLTPEQVEEIARHVEDGVSMYRLAIVYGVHRETIRYHLQKHGEIVEKKGYNVA